jgi:hypothetical protein
MEPGATTPSAFSLTLCGLIDNGDARAQQRLLETTSTEARLLELAEQLHDVNAFYATQAALRRLGASLGGQAMDIADAEDGPRTGT